jgi:hypothetical protein
MHTWVFLDGWSDIQLEVLSLSRQVYGLYNQSTVYSAF